MASREKVLEFVVKERVEAGVSILQIDNGTLFYWRYSSPQRLYTKNQDGKENDAKLPEATLNCDATHGDSIYFSTKSRIFKTVFAASGRVEVTYVRHFLKGEKGTTGGILTRVKTDGKKYAYGMWDDPETGGFVIDDNDDLAREMRLTSTIRNQAIYLSRNKGGPPTVRRLRSDAVVLEVPAAVSTDDRLNTPFFYFKCDTTLYALNVETMAILPPLKINNIDSIASFAGVIDGVATLRVQMGNARYVVTAQLPQEYIGKTVPLPTRTESDFERVDRLCQLIFEKNNVSTRVQEASKSVQEVSLLPQTVTVAAKGVQRNRESASKQLKFADVENWPDYTSILQTEDGTLYYLRAGKPNRLCVKYRGKEVEAKLPDELSSYILLNMSTEVHGNGIFMRDGEKKIYKALFVPPNSIKVQQVSTQDTFPVIKGMRRVRPGFIEDMEHEGVLIDVSEEELEGLKLLGINNGTALYYKDNGVKYNMDNTVNSISSALRRVRSNVIVIEHISSAVYGPNDSCPFAYFIERVSNELLTVDMHAMKFLPTLSLKGVKFINEIVGVYNGKITVADELTESIKSAQLPEGYFLNQSNSLAGMTQAKSKERNDPPSRKSQREDHADEAVQESHELGVEEVERRDKLISRELIELKTMLDNLKMDIAKYNAMSS